MTTLPLTWLYVPGSRPDRFETAIYSGADVVVLDLEDSVHPRAKDDARRNVTAFLARAHHVPVQVRINGRETPWSRADLDALAPFAATVSARVPKVTCAAGLQDVPAELSLHCLIEDARGLEQISAIAACRGVASLALGEADLASDLGVGGAGLLWARGRIVTACRAHGLPPPAMSAYPNLRDPVGLRRHCRLGRRLGFLGASAIHPEQLPVIDAAFRPTAREVQAARAVLEGLSEASDAGSGTVLLPDGRFADPAMVGRARRTVQLADRPPFSLA